MDPVDNSTILNEISQIKSIQASQQLSDTLAAVLGGIGSIPGAMVGGFAIGLCETMLVAFGYSTYSDAFTFILLIVMLLFLPTGLFGEKTAEKV